MNKKFTDRIINNHIFKTIITNNPNILAKLISDLTKIPYSKLINNIFIITNNKQTYNKSKNYDYTVKLNNNTTTNIELNNKSFNGLIHHNLSYSFILYSNNIKNKTPHNNKYLVIQINFNTFSHKHTKYIDIFELRNKKGTKYINNFKIYTLDIVKCHKLYYHSHQKNNSIIKWGAFLYSKIKDNNISNILLNTLTPKELKEIEKALKKETN